MLAATVCSCGRNEEKIPPVAPAPISNLVVTPGEGEPGTDDARGTIKLTWDYPASGDLMYVQIQYVDPLSGDLKKVNVSHFAEGSYTLKGLFKVNGEYSFKVYPVSSTNTFGTPLEGAATSKKVPADINTILTKIPLVADQLDLFPTEPSEGSVAALVDGVVDNASFWHSTWSGTVPPYPYRWSIKLGKEVDRVLMRTTTRQNTGNGAIKTADMYGTAAEDNVSDDAADWTLLASLPEGTFAQGSAKVSDTPVMPIGEPTVEPLDFKFRRLKLMINSSYGSHIMYSELELYSVAYEIYFPDENMADD